MCHFVLNAAVIAEAVKPRSAFTLEYESLVSKKKKKKKKKNQDQQKLISPDYWTLVPGVPGSQPHWQGMSANRV
jgi:hypothetical protein